MSKWDEAAAKMDAAVDEHLSDTISYALDGATFVDMPGYVVVFSEGLGLGEIDPTLGSRNRVKIAKSLVPEVLLTHRLRHEKLGAGTFRPAGENPDEQGRYWIFDVQETI